MQKPSVLYVDDEQQNLNAFAIAFRRSYDIHTALSAREGLIIMRTHPIQVIISDQRMPDMTGIQFLEALMIEFPDVMRILLTGYSDMETLIRGVNNCRIFKYLSKPWNEQELREAINASLLTYSVEHHNKELLLHLQNEVLEQKKLIEELKNQIPIGNMPPTNAFAKEPHL
jgi:response regulator RpfG family c-di-GMP phosphodiesterase